MVVNISKQMGPNRDDHGRRGIALVIVLGLLAIMTMLAVSFAVSMRTERLTARNYLDVVKCRHLTHAAMSRVLEDIDADLDPAAGPLVIYPPWDVICSDLGTNVMRGLDEGEAASYIPDALVNTTKVTSTKVRWQPLYDEFDVGTNRTMIGRYAYLVVNCSGLLDASNVDGLTRSSGTNANEMKIVKLRDFNDPTSGPNFLTKRKNEWKRFETFAELAALGQGENFWSGGVPEHFFVYSKYPEELIDNGAGYEPRFVITNDVSELRSKSNDVVTILRECNVPNPGMVFANLIDYIDADSEPESLSSPCTERVPMINEIACTNYVVLTADGGTNSAVHTLEMYIETWYPFPDAGSCPSIKIKTPAATDITWTGTGGGGVGDNSLNIGVGGTLMEATFSQHDTAYSFRTQKLVFEKRHNYPGPVPIGFQQKLTINRLDLTTDDALGTVLDSITTPLPLMSLIVMLNGGPGIKQGRIAGVSCNDPRLNWDGGDTKQWYSSSAKVTLGEMNDIQETGEGISEMYVRNAPLQSVAELGFLNVGKPWETIALYDTIKSAVNPVLDRFCLWPSRDPKTRGLVNINSPYSNVLACAFSECPITTAPDQPAVTTVTWDDALVMGSAIRQANGIIFTNSSQLCSVSGVIDQLTTMGVTTDAQIESLIRNSYDLFGIRNNTFTILLAVQSVDDINGDDGIDVEEVRSEQRAVATVWRDPYPVTAGAAALHQTFIRNFKWIME